ncbi:MAG: ABC-2 family transporter protein [Sedimentisphaerales bacterium]|nr:ABC-2 family transporter protein [Sedimentisphaerales bacterium]
MKVMAGKYLVIFITQMKNLLEYKINILLKLIRPFVMTAAVGSLWLVLFKLTGRDNIGGFTRQSFIIYLLTIRFIAVFSPGGASIAEMNEEIRTGNLAMRLVRPAHYLPWLLFRNLPVPFISGITGLILVSILTVLLGADLPKAGMMLLFVCSVIATITLQYAIYQGIGILSFWIYEVFPIERFYKSVSGLLSGELIPLTIFPATASEVLQFLPFASLAFIPGGIFTGVFTFEQALVRVIVQWTWAAILWGLVITTYQRGLEKFEAQGG